MGNCFFLSDTSGIAAGLNPQDLQGEVGAAKVPEKWVLALAIGLLPRNIGAFHGVTLDVYGWFTEGMVSACFWMFLDGLWMFMDVSGCLWMFLDVSGCLW